ncbi:MAG: hypothetical protein KDK69_01570 [Chlamydiia bacterium]|nr:hypothetical protein [Chlamydiia bacterium]
MSIEATELSGEALGVTFQFNEKDTQTIWNGRTVSIGNIDNHNPHMMLCGVYLGGVYGTPEPPSPFWGYFDNESKKKNEFDITLYQYHVRCNNEESKKALESAFEKMAYGMVGVVVGVIWFMPSCGASSFQIIECGRQIWMGIEGFKKAMETRGVNLEDVRFVTWYDDYKRNSDELMKNSILDPWKPLDTSGFELMDKQYERKLLDPTLNPWVCA